MAFDLDPDTYADVAYFWHAAAPHHLCIFQPQMQAVMVALYPDNRHADQYGGVAFPYMTVANVLHAALFDDPKLRNDTPLTQIVVNPAKMTDILQAIVDAGISLEAPANRSQLKQRFKDAKQDILVAGMDVDKITVQATDLCEVEVWHPPMLVPDTITAQLDLHAKLAHLCSTPNAEPYAEWLDCVGIYPTRASRCAVTSPLHAFFAALYRVRLGNDALLAGTPAYPAAGHEPLRLVIPSMLAWLAVSRVPFEFQAIVCEPSVLAARQLLSQTLERSKCTTAFSMVGHDRACLSIAVSLFPELNGYFPPSLAPARVSTCFVQLVSILPSPKNKDTSTSAQLRDVSDFLARFANATADSNFEDKHMAFLQQMLEKEKGKTFDNTVKEDGVHKDVTSGTKHDTLYEYCAASTFDAVKMRVETLLQHPEQNTFKIFQVLGTLSKGFVLKFLLSKLVVTVFASFFSQVGTLRHQFHSYVATQLARFVLSSSSSNLNISVEAALPRIFTEQHFKYMGNGQLSKIPWMDICIQLVAISNAELNPLIHGDCICDPVLQMPGMVCLVCSAQFLDETRLSRATSWLSLHLTMLSRHGGSNMHGRS